MHAAIWQMQMFVPGIESGYCDYASGCDSGGPKLASVSSDGSVFVTDIPKTILTKSHADTRGTAAIFRMHRVVNQSYNSECAQSSTESLVHKTAMVYFSSSEHIIRSSVEDLRICLPPVSLHAIDNCPLPPHCNMKNDIEGSVDRNSSSESCSGVNAIYDRRTELKKMNSKSVRCKRLFAYGGSAGMIRLHAIELPWV